MTGLSECFKKGNKARSLKMFDPTPYLTSTLKKDAPNLDFSAAIIFQAAVTTVKTFNEFRDGIKFVQILPSGCSRIDIVCDSYFNNCLKSHIREACSYEQFFPFTEATNIPKDVQGGF